MPKKNFICISSFNADMDWLNELNYPHIIYDKCFKGIKRSRIFPYEIPPSGLKIKYPNFNIINGEIEGYNIYDYLDFIVSNYESLPEIIIFIKGNLLTRHVSKDFFLRVIDNNYFTSIEEWNKNINLNKFSRNSFLSSDGGWIEKNNNWYLNKRKHPTKYFNNFNTFMKFIFRSYVEAKYIRFCPGANYIVPKANILKYEKVFYENLKYIINHSQLSGESHILERALYSIWNSSYEISNVMKNPFNENTRFPQKDKFWQIISRKIISKVL